MTFPLSHLDTSPAVPGRHTSVTVERALTARNRLTCAFRPVLALPHVLLVGGPTAFGLSMVWNLANGPKVEWSAGTGLLGLAAGGVAIIAWFAILFTGTYPKGLWQMAVFYLRWRGRGMAYMALLRDEYPPFGDEPYPAEVRVIPADEPRNRWTTAFRVFLLVPHFIVLWILSAAWLVTTIVAWLAILFTGAFPRTLYDFGVGMVRWSVRVEAYLLLLHDEYPPFALDP